MEVFMWPGPSFTHRGRGKLARPQAEIESSKLVKMCLRKACKSIKTSPQFILHDFDMKN